jgi:hypothetical protein
MEYQLVIDHTVPLETAKIQVEYGKVKRWLANMEM